MRTNDESRIAEEIVSVLPADIVRACSPEKHTIRYSVRADGMKLRTIVLNRASLRRLSEDPLRDIKIEYLRRDLLESAARRKDFLYPRPHVHGVLPRRWAPLGLPIAGAI